MLLVYIRRPSKQFLNHTQPPKRPIMAPKSQKWPQNKSKSNVRIEGNIENESCSITWVDSKTVFEPFPNPKKSPLGPQKVKSDPKIKSKSNVRIKRNKENESCSTTWVDPKSVVEPYSNPKNSQLSFPTIKKMTHKLSQNQRS